MILEFYAYPKATKKKRLVVLHFKTGYRGGKKEKPGRFISVESTNDFISSLEKRVGNG